jgi:CheY-like chemotaxis protein/ketosteroid isomerase-like protein
MKTDTTTQSDIDALTALNRDYIQSVQHGDIRRFDEILAEDFLCSNPDGSLVDKNQFLAQTARPVTITDLEAQDVRVRILGDVAIIYARTNYTTADGGRIRFSATVDKPIVGPSITPPIRFRVSAVERGHAEPAKLIRQRCQETPDPMRSVGSNLLEPEKSVDDESLHAAMPHSLDEPIAEGAAVRRNKLATPSADFRREDAGQRLRLLVAGVQNHGYRHRTRPYVRQRRGDPERIPSTKDRRTARGQGGSATSREVIMPTVLVVDDEFGIVDVLETILIDEGYRVLTACNGKQGLVRLSAEKPDVVLLDFMMPILGGAEMLRAMAAEPVHQRIPVIMISSLREDVIAEKCKGYAAFLHKPFRAAAVLSTIARVLGSGANAAA